jgi:hypothetical protein
MTTSTRTAAPSVIRVTAAAISAAQRVVWTFDDMDARNLTGQRVLSLGAEGRCCGCAGRNRHGFSR